MNTTLRWLAAVAACAALGGCRAETGATPSSHDHAAQTDVASDVRRAGEAFSRALSGDPDARLSLTRFANDGAPLIAACVGAPDATWMPTRALVAFERGGDDAAPRYYAASIHPTAGAAGLDPRATACLARLRGRALDLPPSLAQTAPRRFVRSVVLTLPTTGGAR